MKAGSEQLRRWRSPLPPSLASTFLLRLSPLRLLSGSAACGFLVWAANLPHSIERSAANIRTTEEKLIVCWPLAAVLIFVNQTRSPFRLVPGGGRRAPRQRGTRQALPPSLPLRRHSLGGPGETEAGRGPPAPLTCVLGACAWRCLSSSSSSLWEAAPAFASFPTFLAYRSRLPPPGARRSLARTRSRGSAASASLGQGSEEAGERADGRASERASQQEPRQRERQQPRWSRG